MDRCAARVAFSRRADVELTREHVDAFDFEEIPDRVISSGGLTAFPALVDLGETVALRVFERRDDAQAAHRGGVERLLRQALGDAVKQARRQLPLKNHLLLKSVALDGRLKIRDDRKNASTPLGSPEALRADIVEGALRERLAARDLDLRSRADFERVRDDLARSLFASAMARLEIVEDIIANHAELKPLLEPPLLGFARANYDDIEDQLAELLAPGFVRGTERSRLAHFPRYLRAMRPACRALASGSRARPGAHADRAALLAGLPEAACRARRDTGACRAALADRGTARVDVRAGTAHRRTRVA